MIWSKYDFRLLRLLPSLLLATCVASTGDVEREIRQQYALLERAYAAQDFDAVMSSRDVNLVVVVPGTDGATEDYEQTARLMRRWFNENKPPIDVRYRIEAIEVRSPDEAVVHVLQRGSRYRDGKDGRHHVEHEVRERETWVRTSSGWKITRIDNIDLANRKVWVNGTPIPLADQ